MAPRLPRRPPQGRPVRSRSRSSGSSPGRRLRRPCRRQRRPRSARQTRSSLRPPAGSPRRRTRFSRPPREPARLRSGRRSSPMVWSPVTTTPTEIAAPRIAGSDVPTAAPAGLSPAAGRDHGVPAEMLPRFASIAGTPSAPTGTTADGGPLSSGAPADSVPPVPPGAPFGVGVAGAGGVSGFGGGLVAVLFVALGGFAVQRLFRLVVAAARCRPVAFCWLLERPG